MPASTSYRRVFRPTLALVFSVLSLLAACERDETAADPAAESPVTTSVTTTDPAIRAATTTTITTTTAPTATTPAPPPTAPAYQPAPNEEQPQLKEDAARIAEALTTYEVSEDYASIARSVAEGSPVDELIDAAAPLSEPGHWSRGNVIYPQMGGIPGDRASVMVVTEQRIGTGAEPERTTVRILDVRLLRDGGEWRFDRLASAGGEPRDRPGHLAGTAAAVVDDLRIELPDSARWDIYAGAISPLLLELMADLSEQTPFGVVVLQSGHPQHVFETDRVSHHSVGMAVDIYRFGDEMVIDDRQEDSDTRRWVEWLLDDLRVRQVGSPWDLDGASSSRSFTDPAHQDHVHVAVDS